MELNFVRQMARAWLAVPSQSLFPGKVGFVRIENWHASVADQFRAAVKYLKKIGMEKIVLDVRNPGGSLGETLSTITFFESNKDKALLISRGKHIGEKKYTRATLPSENMAVYPPLLENMPCAVIISGESASASEIFAAYLKHKGCYMVGEKTYGKGVMQAMMTLPSGAGLWLTVAEYFVGPNIKIEGVGISATIGVSNPTGWQSTDEKNDLQKKVAIETLRNTSKDRRR
jgi:carboxyl-terminal processing protease